MYKCSIMKAVVGGYKLDGGGVQVFKLRAERGKGVRVQKSGDLGRASPGPHPGPVSTRCVTIGKISVILGLHASICQ